MSKDQEPTSPAAPPPGQPVGITTAASASLPGAWEWGIGVPPAWLPSMAEGLTGGASRPVAPSSSQVHVEGSGRHETVWNPLEGDPLRMAALGASAAVQTGMTPPVLPSVNGNGATTKAMRAEPPAVATAPASVTPLPAAGPAVDDRDAADAPTAMPPAGARMRPVTGRRQRDPLPVTVSITAGSYRSNLVPPAAASAAARAQAAGAEAAPFGGGESGPAPSGRRRTRVLVALLVAVLVAAGAAGAIFVAVPARAVLQASLAYERDGGDAPIDDRALREFHEAQEAMLWSKGVRERAVELLAERGLDVEAGFLANVHQLPRGARVGWDTNADATRDELTLAYPTTARQAAADAQRLTALFRALHAAAASGDPGGRVDELKLQLIQTEVDDYARELEYLKRRLQTLQEELRIVRLGAPTEGEIETLKSDVSRLSAAYQNALAARIRAEVEGGVAPAPAPAPATMPAGDEGVLPPPLLEIGPVGAEQHRRIEREALVALRSAERDLAEAVAQQETIEEKERELNGVTDTIESLSRTLEGKREELAAAGRERRPRFTPLPPSPARVVEEHDARPLWIGVAVAVVSVCFAGYVALTARGKGDS